MVSGFLKRDDTGHFFFMHRSFMEFFLARRLMDMCLEKNNTDLLTDALNTRWNDQKTIYFLTLLDQPDLETIRPSAIVPKLQKILTQPYKANVSENALQILYWFARICCQMEIEIHDIRQLNQQIETIIPEHVDLKGAKLQEIILEGIVFNHADLSTADLSSAKLNHAILRHVNLTEAGLSHVKARFIQADYADFTGADIDQASFKDAIFTHCTEDQRIQQTACQASQGIITKAGLLSYFPVVQTGLAFAINSIAFNHDASLMASASVDHTIIIWDVTKGSAIRVLEGHTSYVRSVSFSPSEDKIASGSYDHTVRLWDVAKGCESSQ